MIRGSNAHKQRVTRCPVFRLVDKILVSSQNNKNETRVVNAQPLIAHCRSYFSFVGLPNTCTKFMGNDN